MTKFKGGKLIDEILEAVDDATAQFVTNTQSKLSASSPVATGRLASSWFVNRQTPSGKEPPEEPWASKQDDEAPTIIVERYKGKITFGPDWVIDSNLPYSERAALDPRWAKGGRNNGAQWFTSIRDNLQRDANRVFSKAMKKA